MYISRSDKKAVDGLKRLKEAYLELIAAIIAYLLVSLFIPSSIFYIGVVIAAIFFIGAIRLLSGLKVLGESDLESTGKYTSAYKWLRNTIAFLLIDILISVINVVAGTNFTFDFSDPIKATIFIISIEIIFVTLVVFSVFIIKYTEALQQIAQETGQSNYKYGAIILAFLVITGILIILLNHIYNSVYSFSQIASQFSILADGFYIINIISLYFCYTATSKSLDNVRMVLPH